jgi:tetratricopeptide (TPR) repeat protein
MKVKLFKTHINNVVLPVILLAIIVSLISPSLSWAEMPTETLKRGIELANNGKYKKALDLYSEVIGVDPNIAHAYAYRSLTLIQLGRLDGAIRDSKKAMELSQERGIKLLSLSNLGAAYLKKAKYELAVSAFEELLTLDKNDPIPHFFLGESFRGIGGEEFLKKAYESYTSAIELDDTYALAYYFRAEVKQKLGDEIGADEDFKTACELDASLCK